MGNIAQLDISGERAIENAIQMLQGLDNISGAKRVNITISDMDSEEDPDVEAHEETSEDEGAERHRGEIKADTSHHHTLYALAQLTQDGGHVPGNDVADAVNEYNPTSVRPALTQMHQRMLVDRERVDGSNPHYEYKLTDWGKEVLNELGQPE